MLDLQAIRTEFVRPALKSIDLWSPAAEDLVFGTGLQESQYQFLHQGGVGPALGYWQMEPATANDIWTNFLAFRPALRDATSKLLAGRDRVGTLVTDPIYAAAMCRLRYYRVSAPLPPWGDVNAYGAYWKQWYNTPAGAGTAEEWVKNWNMLQEDMNG